MTAQDTQELADLRVALSVVNDLLEHRTYEMHRAETAAYSRAEEVDELRLTVAALTDELHATNARAEQAEECLEIATIGLRGLLLSIHAIDATDEADVRDVLADLEARRCRG